MTALKTISMYLRAAKTEAEEAGESTDGMANSVSELREELLTLTKGKVDIMLDDKTFKSTYEIMKDLSKIWEDLADIDKANIIELIGGKRNANAITSLLTNFEDAENALQTASTAAGSAYAENEKYLDSIAGKISILQSKFETFSNNLIDSGAVKFVVDLGSGLLTVLDFLNPILPLLAGVSTALILVAKQAMTSVNAVTNQIMLETAALVNEHTASESLKVSVAGLTAAEQRHLVVQLQRKVAAGELTKEQYQQIVSTLGLSSAEKGLVAADGALVVANKSLGASFKSLMASIPIWGWIALGISLVLELATAIGDLAGNAETSAEKISRLDDEFDELINNAQSLSSEYSDLKKTTDEIIPRFIELAKGVNEFGENMSLTDDEYEEFLSLNNQIAEMFPELDMGLDSNGNHILALSYSIDSLTESLEALLEAERNATNEKIADNMGDALKNIKSANKAYEKEIKQVESNKEYLESVYAALPSKGSVTVEKTGSNAGALNKRDELLRSLGVDITSEIVNNPTNATRSAKFNYTFDYNEEDVKRNYENMLAGYEKQIESLNTEQQARWQKLNPIMGAWLQTTDDYGAVEEDVQQLLTKVFSNIDYSEIGITEEKKLKEYMTENFVKPITEAQPEVQNAMVGLFDIKSAFDSGVLTVGEYGITDYILGDLQSAGMSDTVMSALNKALNLDDFKEQLDEIKGSIEGTDEEVLAFVNDLTYNDFNLVYSVVQENGSMSIEELQEKIKQVRYAAADMVEPLNMGDFIEGLEETASAVDKVTSAMAKLQEGTALSKKELMDLISEYPKLLKQEDLFADGSVEAQKNALDAILDLKEQEYDAKIDEKIAELKATQTVLQDQLGLETEKANLIKEISNLEVNGKIEQESEFLEKLSELNNLQGQNYVDLQDGELQVNEEALNDKLSQENDYANTATDNIWQPYGETIVSSHTQGYSGSLTATDNYTKSLWQRFKNFCSRLGTAVANAVKDMFAGEWKGISTYFSEAMGSGDTTVSGGVISVNFGGEKTTINGQNVDEWISDQKKASDLRIAQIEDFKQRTLNAIENLEALKGLDLTTIYGTTGSSSSKTSKEVEEYIADIDAYYAALKRLESAQAKVENLEQELSHTNDPAAKIKLYDQIVDAYKEEAEAERNLINKRTATIQDNIKALRNLGFEVEYNAKTNDLYIKNLDHVNELTATSKGNYDTLQEATNALRKETEELINTTEDLNDSNRDSIDNIEDLAYEIQDVAEEIIDCIEEVYQEQIDAYNDIIEKRKEAIESAKDEYDYEEDVAEKVKEIAELQAKIDKLSLDNSREAQAQKAALIEELQEKQKELNETQSDHAYDEQIDALDKMSEKYEEEKNAELDILRESIGTVQDLGTVIDTRVTNAWKNAKKAVKEYGQSVAGLNGGVVTNVGTVPKYHSGGVVGGNATGKEEILALLEAGEIVLNDQKQEAVYKIIDFQSKLAERLGVALGSTTLPLTTLDTAPAIDGMAHGVINTSTQTVFNPEFTIEINHNGDMSDDEARRYGEEIADTAIAKLYNAFERKGISNHNGAKLKP